MTDIEQKALALVNASSDEWYQRCTEANVYELYEALCRAIEQHEAFKQEVSDAVVCYFSGVELDTRLHRFIITKPKPDPLVDAIESVLSGFESRKHAESYAHHIRAKLENSGFEIEIREKG